MENLAKENYDELINYVCDKFATETREDAEEIVKNIHLLMFGEYDRYAYAMSILESDEFSTKDKGAILFVLFCSDAFRIGQCDGTLAERIESVVLGDKFAEGKDEATVKEIQEMVCFYMNFVYDRINKLIA